MTLLLWLLQDGAITTPVITTYKAVKRSQPEPRGSPPGGVKRSVSSAAAASSSSGSVKSPSSSSLDTGKIDAKLPASLQNIARLSGGSSPVSPSPVAPPAEAQEAPAVTPTSPGGGGAGGDSTINR